MKSRLIAAAAIVSLSPAALAQEVDADTVAKIETLLADMQCQMDPGDIEATEAGYELDDVICEGGRQFDIELDKGLMETGRRAE